MKKSNSSRRYLPAMPIEIDFFGPYATVSMARDGDDSIYTFHHHPHRQEDGLFPLQVDLEGLRSSFLSVSTTGEALEFLEQTGYFLLEPDSDESTLRWSEFQVWQLILREVVSGGFLFMMKDENREDGVYMTEEERLSAEMRHAATSSPEPIFGWLTGLPNRMSVNTVPVGDRAEGRNRLELSISCGTTVEAILADFYVDTLNGINYQLCARHDCNEIFEASPTRGKKYHSTACAHLASMRESRKNKTLKVEPETKKSRKRNGK
jgi:hypothetical protein